MKSMKAKRQTWNGRRRSGISLAELVLAAGLLIGVMTFVTTICFRVHLVWRDVRQQRLAMHEVAGQLDRLSMMNLDAATAELDQLSVSAELGDVLNQPKLTGSINEDAMGYRISLQLNWQRKLKRKPVELSAWIIGETSKGEPDE